MEACEDNYFSSISLSVLMIYTTKQRTETKVALNLARNVLSPQLLYLGPQNSDFKRCMFSSPVQIIQSRRYCKAVYKSLCTFTGKLMPYPCINFPNRLR